MCILYVTRVCGEHFIVKMICLIVILIVIDLGLLKGKDRKREKGEKKG